MDSTRSSRLAFPLMPWALLLIWCGILELAPARPQGTGALGVALILLGVNALRLATGSDVSRPSIAVGIAALVAGGLSLSQETLRLPFDIPTFPVMLITCGAVFLTWDILNSKTDRSASAGEASHAKHS